MSEPESGDNLFSPGLIYRVEVVSRIFSHYATFKSEIVIHRAHQTFESFPLTPGRLRMLDRLIRGGHIVFNGYQLSAYSDLEYQAFSVEFVHPEYAHRQTMSENFTFPVGWLFTNRNLFIEHVSAEKELVDATA